MILRGDQFGHPAGVVLSFFVSCVDLGKAAFAGFAEAVVQIDAGLVHSTADHIIADITGACQEEAQVAGIHSAHCSHGISFNTGDLHQTTDGVTGQTQMVLHRSLSRVLHLIQVLLIQLRLFNVRTPGSTYKMFLYSSIKKYPELKNRTQTSYTSCVRF